MCKGEEVDAWDPVEGRTMAEAAVRGKYDMIAVELFARGANPNTRCVKDGTLLHVAAMSGRDAIVKALLANGGDKDAKDGFGETPLMKACHLGHTEIAETLMAVGSDVNTRGTGSSRYTAIDRAAENRRADN